jgi:hypothetical protein
MTNLTKDPVQEVMRRFYEKVNPEISFKNTTIRSAALYLVEKFGLEPILTLIDTLPQSNLEQFAPKIYTPLDMKNKWTALGDYWKRKGAEQNKSRFIDLTNR